MINITQNASQYVDLSLSELITITNPYFIFRWVDKYSAEEIKTYEDLSAYPDRYNRFLIVDASNFNLKYSGTYEVYESLIDTSTIDGLHLLEAGQYTLHKTSLGYTVFDPSYAVIDGYKVLNPTFNINSGGKYFQDPSISELFVLLDTSLGDVTKGYVDGSLANRDISINELYGLIEDISIGGGGASILYVDGSLANRDLSINELNVKNISQDASIDVLKTKNISQDVMIVRLDGSVNKLFSKSNSQDSSVVALRSKDTNIDTSLNNIWIKFGSVDTSLNNLGIVNISQDASIVSLQNNYISLANTNISQDASIVSLRNTNTSQDASIVNLQGNITTLTNKDITVDASIVRIDSVLLSKLDNTTDTFTGTLTVDGSLYLIGNMYVDGSTYVIKAQSLDVSNNFIALRAGAAVQIPDGSISGLRITKADGTNNVIFGSGNDAILRIGWENDSLQAIATREDSPTDTWFVYWDDSSNMLKTYNLKGYVDGSLGARDISINNLNNKNISQDASIVNLQNKDITLDASIVRIDGSINYLFANAGFGSLKEASLGTDFVWNAGLLDVSVIGAKDGSIDDLYFQINDLGEAVVNEIERVVEYIDGSLSYRDTSIDLLYTTKLNILDASSNYAKRLTSFTSINADSYTVNDSDNLNIIQCDASTVITFPNTLVTGFQTTVFLNVSTGFVTLNASTFRSTDASIRLKDIYAAATVVHQGSGIFYGFGNLK